MNSFSGGVLFALVVCLPGTVAAGDIAYGEYLSSECVTCHQVSGADEGIPPIIGWDADAFVAVMNSYKQKEREHQVMQTIAGRLDDEQIASLAAYFATIPAPE